MDARGYVLMEIFGASRRQLHKNPELQALFARVWAKNKRATEVGKRQHRLGPVGLIFKEVKECNMEWEQPWAFQREGRADLPLVGGPDGWWKHEIRDIYRRSEWSRAQGSRETYEGVGNGIDREATTSLMKSKQGISDYDKGVLQSIVAGAPRAQHQLDAANTGDKIPFPEVHDNICPYCRAGHVETHKHIWWECPRWAKNRENHPGVRTVNTEAWPACLTNHGIMPLFPHKHEIADYRRHREGIPAHWIPKGAGEFHFLGRKVVWSDGSANSARLPRHLRRSAWGVYWGKGHPNNISGPTAGQAQTINRAELEAIDWIFKIEKGPLGIRSDSAFVVDKMHLLLDGWLPCATWEHEDLWHSIWCEVRSRP